MSVYAVVIEVTNKIQIGMFYISSIRTVVQVAIKAKN